MSSDSMFNKLEENWQLVKKIYVDRLDPRFDVDHGIFCPICLNHFIREDILYKNITQEHVPPYKLGGNVMTLTCQTCNNDLGSKLDAHLIKKSQIEAFWADENSTATIPAEFEVDGKHAVIVDLARPKENQLLIVPPEGIRKTNPRSVENVNKQLGILGKSFKLRFGGYSEVNSKMAIIKAGYLWAFSCFGYAFVMNSPINKLRFQILNPQESIIPLISVFSGDFPDEAIGLYVIKYPVEARAFFVVLETKIDGYTKRYGVPLPGFSTPDLQIYEYFHKNQEKLSQIEFAKIESFDIAKYPFDALEIWDTVINLPS